MEKQQNKKNYQRALEEVLAQESGRTPTLLLHSCCAPCSSYVLEYLSQYFAITVFYYNPNIYPESEYGKRVEEQRRLISALNEERKAAVGGPAFHEIKFLEGPFEPQRFYQAVKGLEKIPEGGARCHACFRLRLSCAAEAARAGGFDYVTTTLTISPLKNAEKLNKIGEACAEQNKVRWLPSDFKKKNGYKRSTELSEMYGLYRQDYCGCVFSKQERESQKQQTAEAQRRQKHKDGRM